MEKFETADAILDFAIENEIESYKFYTDLATKAAHPEMKMVFLDFAAEEQKHKQLLEDAKKGKKISFGKGEKIADLKIADFTVDVQPTPNMEYKDALVLAMKKEKKAFQLYTMLANIADTQNEIELFRSLAQQEAKHKLRFELEYDQIVLKED